MKKGLFILTTCFAFGIFILACGGKSRGEWSEADVNNATANCLAGKDPSLSDDQNKKACDCWVNKVMAMSPDPAKQSDIPIKTVMEFTEQCRNDLRSK